MSRFGSRMSNEDVTEWPELKDLPQKEDANAVLIAELAAKVDALTEVVNAKIAEPQTEVIK